MITFLGSRVLLERRRSRNGDSTIGGELSEGLVFEGRKNDGCRSAKFAELSLRNRVLL